MSTATASGKPVRVVRTTDLARRLNRSSLWVEQLLSETEADGIVERVGTGWRLSDAGERRFGRALRSLNLPRDCLEVPAGGNAW